MFSLHFAKKIGLCSKICIRSSEKCDSLISKSQNDSWWRGWGKLPKQEYLILALSKCGILICHGLFVSNISSDEKKHANKKNPTPYLEFNKIFHLILFSFFEKFNMNTQVLHSFKLCGSCWCGSCATLMCQVPREGALKAAVIQIIWWDCPDGCETSVWQAQYKNRDRNCLSWGNPPDLWIPWGQGYVFAWSDAERMG